MFDIILSYIKTLLTIVALGAYRSHQNAFEIIFSTTQATYRLTMQHTVDFNIFYVYMYCLPISYQVFVIRLEGGLTIKAGWMQESVEDEKLCVYLIEKALSRLPEGRNDILTIIDLRGFGTKNADLKFVTFLVMLIEWNAI